MQNNKLFDIGEKIQIIRKNDKEDKRYSSQVLDIIDENTFIISGPIYKKSLIFLHLNEVVDIACTRENKGMYKFSAIVEQRDLNKLYTIKIRKITNIERLQQRKYYRFETNIPVEKLLLVSKRDKKNKERNIKEDCITKDISGNGMKLMCNYKHSVGDKIYCNFKIYDQVIIVEGEVVRIEEIDAFNFNYAIGIKFLDIVDQERDIIVKYIFDQERKLRNKGLI